MMEDGKEGGIWGSTAARRALVGGLRALLMAGWPGWRGCTSSRLPPGSLTFSASLLSCRYDNAYEAPNEFPKFQLVGTCFILPGRCFLPARGKGCC